MAKYFSVKLQFSNSVTIVLLLCGAASTESANDVDGCRGYCDDLDDYFCDDFLGICEPCSMTECVKRPSDPSACPTKCVEFFKKTSSATTDGPNLPSRTIRTPKTSRKPFPSSALPWVRIDDDKVTAFRIPDEDSDSSWADQQMRIQTTVVWLLVAILPLAILAIIITIVTGCLIRVGRREPPSYKRPAKVDNRSSKQYVLAYDYSPFLTGRECAKSRDIFTA